MKKPAKIDLSNFSFYNLYAQDINTNHATFVDSRYQNKHKN